MSTQHLADNGVDVDRLVDGAPHAQVLERVLALDVAELQLVAALVETEILRSDIGGVGELESSFLLQTRDVLEGGIDDEVDLARYQRRHPRRVGLDDDVDRLVDIAALAPPIRVGDQHGAGVGFVALEAVGPGAVGVANRVGLLPRIVILRLDDPVRRGPRLAHDADVHEFFRQHGVGRGEQEVDGQIVDLARRLDTTQLEGPLRILGQRPLDRKHDIVGGERCAIVKLDPGAELEAPAFRFHVLPRYGERGLEREIAVAAHQRIVNLTDHARVVLQCQRMRIHRLRVERARHALRFRRVRERSQASGKQH